MTRLSLICAAIAAATIACGDKKSPAPTAKPAEAAAPAPVVPPLRIGALDLSAAVLDLPAAFPGASYVLHRADPPDTLERGGYARDTAELRGDRGAIIGAVLDRDVVRAIDIRDASVSTPSGVRVGARAADVARALPDATCRQGELDTVCTSPASPDFAYTLTAVQGAPIPDGAAITAVTSGEVSRITWTPPPGRTVKLAAIPTQIAEPDLAPADIGDDADLPFEGGKLEGDAIDRCARLLVVTSKCKVTLDPEFGWLPGGKPLSAAAARARCEAFVASEDQPTPPAPPLVPAKLARVEAAQQQSCAAMFKVLDEVDPRVTEAGEVPTDEGAGD